MVIHRWVNKWVTQCFDDFQAGKTVLHYAVEERESYFGTYTWGEYQSDGFHTVKYYGDSMVQSRNSILKDLLQLRRFNHSAGNDQIDLNAVDIVSFSFQLSLFLTILKLMVVIKYSAQ